MTLTEAREEFILQDCRCRLGITGSRVGRRQAYAARIAAVREFNSRREHLGLEVGDEQA